MRKISTKIIEDQVRALCLRNAFQLPPQVRLDLQKALSNEVSPVARRTLSALLENADLAVEKRIPLCQDTGLIQVIVEIGQGISLSGSPLAEAINQGVASAYDEGYLRKSSCHPIKRENLGDNTPASVDIRLNAGDKLHLTVFSKGGGCDNTSRLFMLKPAEGWAGVRQAVLTAAREAGPGACPPYYMGVAVGGSFESAPRLAREALLNVFDAPDNCLQAEELLQDVNALGLGPMGLGGQCTALGLGLKIHPTHLASLPVAINMCCHSFRFSKAEL